MRVLGYLAAALAALAVAAPAYAQSPEGAGAGPELAQPNVVIINPAASPEATAPAVTAPQPAPAPPASEAVDAPAARTPEAPASGTAAPSPSPPPAPAANAEAPADATAPAPPAPAPTAPPANTPAEAKAEPATPPPEPTLLVDIDLGVQRMTVFDNGAAKHTWPISSARYGYSTPTGTFQPSWMSKMWYSRQYDYAPMPNAIFFSRGTAIHATYATSMLGRPASHGCVRLAPRNAATLYKLVGKHGKAMTTIVVHGTPKMPSVAERRRDDSRQASARRSYGYPPGGYGYPPGYGGRYYAYDAPYYAPLPRRSYYVKPPRRYVQRGYYGRYGYGYGF